MDEVEGDATAGPRRRISDTIDEEVGGGIAEAWLLWHQWAVSTLAISEDQASELQELAERLRKDALRLSVETGPSDLADYWDVLRRSPTEDAEAWERINTAELAGLLADVGLTEGHWERMERYFLRDRRDDPREQLMPLLELGFVSDAYAMSSQAAERYLELRDLCISERLTPKVAVYIARPARLYVYGFYAESVALARAALEAALNAAVPFQRLEELQRKQRKEKKRVSGDLAGRITCACEDGLLEAAQCRSARDINTRANSVLHVADRPEPTEEQALAVLGSLVEVATRLAAAPPRPEAAEP